MSEAYVSADYLKKAADWLKQLKQMTYDRMQIEAGHHVLDVGCGPGMDTVPLADRVGPTGRVVGVDTDPNMLKEADRFAESHHVEKIVFHQQGDAQNLAFEDAAFDSVRAERLFQVLPAAVDPHSVLKEMIRVTKPGGWVVLADTDWATASVDYPDYHLERRLMQFFTSTVRPNGLAGRQFLQWMHIHHLQSIDMAIFPMAMTQINQTPFGNWLAEEAVAADIASDDEMREWINALTARSESGSLYVTANMVVVSGQKVKI